MDSLSLNLSSQLLFAGDLAFLAGLGLLAVLSWAAGLEIPRDYRVPMQWGLGGKASWRAQRRFALLFAPIIAAISGLLLTFFAHTLAHELSDELLKLAIIRVGVALAFVFAHILHLGLVLREIKSGKPKS